MPDTDMHACARLAQALARAPDPESLATDALCHISAALSVLEMHVERSNRAMVVGVHDLLRSYHLKADRAAAEQPDEALASSVLPQRSEEHTSELQSPCNLVCRLLLEKKKKTAHCSTSYVPYCRSRTANSH